MSTQISPPIRIVAVVGIVVALALGGYMMLMGGSGSGPVPVTPPALPRPASAQPPATGAAAANPKPAATPSAPAKHAAAPATKHAAATAKHAAPAKRASAPSAPAKPKPAAAAAPAAAKPAAAKAKTKAAAPSAAEPKKAAAGRAPSRKAVAAARSKGLPASIATALSAHPVVVVAIFAADAQVDRLALNEAKSGAATAHAGFVAVRTNGADALALSKTFGVLSDPSVLVLKRPGTVYVRFDGFADALTVAQAATNAG